MDRPIRRHIPPHAKVAFQDCLWTVIWCDGELVCIESCVGTEVRVENVEDVEEVQDPIQ